MNYKNYIGKEYLLKNFYYNLANDTENYDKEDLTDSEEIENILEEKEIFFEDSNFLGVFVKFEVVGEIKGNETSIKITDVFTE